MARVVSRRTLVKEAAAGAALASAGGLFAAEATAKRRRDPTARRPRGPRVAVLGGGMAGLAAAHELAERGFEVHVFERKALGGKARSIPVPGTAAGGRLALPGEHGFRFFPGFYHHVPDSMRRIPFPGNANGVWDNLVEASESKAPRTNGRADSIVFPVAPDPNELRTPDGMRRVLTDFATGQGVPPHEAAYFVERVMVFLTSCDERRYGQWEHVSWWDFIKAEGKSAEYQNALARGLTRTLVAAKERKASSRTIANMLEAFVWNIAGRGNDGALDRVLNAPTNEAWIDPWLIHLKKLGVRFHVGYDVNRLEMRRGRVLTAKATRRKRRRTIEADWFVCAMPVERARKLWSPAVLRRDESLKLMDDLYVDWMNGIQYYLTKPFHVVRGHLAFADAPWALTALTQGQFWGHRDFERDYGDGTVVDSFSVDISDWDTPGMFNGKTAKVCTPDEVAKEVFEQIKAHLNDNGEDILTDDMVHSWFLDPAIRWHPKRGRNTNDDPLLVNTIGSWQKRPTPRTEIPNLFLAGDYVQTDLDLATMEGANESGREAVNQLLDTVGSPKERVAKYHLFNPPEWEPIWAADRELWQRGQPNALDLF